MKSIIVGTAGHIDHGKTALVKALTGIDADRLEEEKRRGITIDLGFAHMDLPGEHGEKLRLGFVDVPGHERFVRNMLAGVGGIDLVLLVIAADESIKPQTREHFDILKLIGVKRGITVLTKSDNVDQETLEVVRLEVEEFLRGTFLETPAAPLVAVSSLTGAGLEELKAAIVAAAAKVSPRDSRAFARLPIDRVFTMKGFGTVVTGTLISGAIRKEEELEVFPSGQRVRVRGVQVHGQSADTALAGQRTALNLVGVSTEEVVRGMMLATPDTFSATRRIDVQLQLLGSAPRPLKARARVHFHTHTMETVAELRPHGNPHVAPGDSAMARLLIPAPALLLPGDRFIIRQFSPVVTIGGGVVVDANPIKRTSQAADYLPALTSGTREEILQARIARQGGLGISMARLTAETGLRPEAIDGAIASSVKNATVVKIADTFLHAPAIQLLKTGVLSALEQFHKKDPLQPGMGREQLREHEKIAPEIFGGLLEALSREKKVETSGDLVRLPGRSVVLKDEEAESKKQIEAAFAGAGLKVPALYDVIAGLKVDKGRAQKIVTLLLRDKVLIKISDDLVFHRTALEGLRRQISAQKAKSPRMDVAQFKELTGVSRKYAIPLLEYLDRERVTRRAGDVREIL
ncbi:MAG TPA: selenocysteine-specific translation elongation factor [Candidatus Sulfotelmatobacter sp.]|nr:selenocysteine-specific translation elongation factor [Candidatus Sulfotelmatobacter sp.]